MTLLPFDRVVVASGEARSDFSVEQFLALPNYQRAFLLLSDDLAFFLGEEQVDRAAALKAIMELGTAQPSGTAG